MDSVQRGEDAYHPQTSHDPGLSGLSFFLHLQSLQPGEAAKKQLRPGYDMCRLNPKSVKREREKEKKPCLLIEDQNRRESNAPGQRRARCSVRS